MEPTEPKSSKVIVVGVVGLVVGLLVGYFGYGLINPSPVTTETNPLAEVKANPLDDVKTNPYEDVKYNPFE